MLRILIVDDNHDVADSMLMLMQSLGHDVRCVYSGAAALDAISTFRPHIAFVDLFMPEMDGWETSRRIRASPDGEHITLAALTGAGNEKDRIKTAHAGFDCHFVKPLEFDVLQLFLTSIEGASFP